MNECYECDKQLKESETYKIKPKGEPDFWTFCQSCSLKEYTFFLKHNERVVIITPDKGIGF